jgi:hypothetical protein
MKAFMSNGRVIGYGLKRTWKKVGYFILKSISYTILSKIAMILGQLSFGQLNQGSLVYNHDL